MEWSSIKVTRIDNGDASIAPNDLRALLDLLGFEGEADAIRYLPTHFAPGLLQTSGYTHIFDWPQPSIHVRGAPRFRSAVSVRAAVPYAQNRQ
jgi:hypothetical protein